ncbi:MAG: DUF370 domain-containing protein [Oscillospiraceae bacterium]|nr:DUF370 domain-containing protein [Oscillospiraceae bacterium]
MDLLDIGYGNLISKARIISIIHPSSAPAKRLIKSAAAINKLIDASSGRKTGSVIITDSDHVILSPLSTQQLQSS